jgi:hypothetical protein
MCSALQRSKFRQALQGPPAASPTVRSAASLRFAAWAMIRSEMPSPGAV